MIRRFLALGLLAGAALASSGLRAACTTAITTRVADVGVGGIVTLRAVGGPSGGVFEWEVVDPPAFPRVRPHWVLQSTDSFTLHGVRASDALRDVTVRVTYREGTDVCTAERQLTVVEMTLDEMTFGDGQQGMGYIPVFKDYQAPPPGARPLCKESAFPPTPQAPCPASSTCTAAAQCCSGFCTNGCCAFTPPSFDTDAYPAPHWKSDRPEASTVAYRRSTRDPKTQVESEMFVRVLAVFKVKPNAYAEDITIVGKGPDGDRFIHTRPAFQGSWGTNMDSGDALPFNVRFYDPYKIEWKASLDSRRNSFDVGKSENRMYVTLDWPREYGDTYLYISTKAADGMSEVRETFDAIWEAFKNRAVKNAACQDLGYYKGNTCVHHCRGVTPELLISDTNGRCGSWQQLMIRSVYAQGISGAEPVGVHVDVEAVGPNGFCNGGRSAGTCCSSPADCSGRCNRGHNANRPCVDNVDCPGTCSNKNSECFDASYCPPGGTCNQIGACMNVGVCNTAGVPIGFLVKKWSFKNLNQTSGCTAYPYRHNSKCETLPNPVDRWANVDTVKKEGLPGQDNKLQDVAEFTDHAIVQFMDKYYDPSYGTGPFDGGKNADGRRKAIVQLEDAAIAGFVSFGKVGAAGRPLYSARLKKNAGKPEILFNPNRSNAPPASTPLTFTTTCSGSTTGVLPRFNEWVYLAPEAISQLEACVALSPAQRSVLAQSSDPRDRGVAIFAGEQQGDLPFLLSVPHLLTDEAPTVPYALETESASELAGAGQTVADYLKAVYLDWFGVTVETGELLSPYVGQTERLVRPWRVRLRRAVGDDAATAAIKSAVLSLPEDVRWAVFADAHIEGHYEICEAKDLLNQLSQGTRDRIRAADETLLPDEPMFRVNEGLYRTILLDWAVRLLDDPSCLPAPAGAR